MKIGSLTLSLPSRSLALDPVKMAIRPNRIILRPQGSTPAYDNTSHGTILKSTYVGNHMEYRVATEFGEWFATSDDVDQVLTTNQAVDINFAERGPVLLPA